MICRISQEKRTRLSPRVLPPMTTNQGSRQQGTRGYRRVSLAGIGAVPRPVLWSRAQAGFEGANAVPASQEFRLMICQIPQEKRTWLSPRVLPPMTTNQGSRQQGTRGDSRVSLAGIGAGPQPVLGCRAQTGFYRVLFDVHCDFLFLDRVSNPSIEIVPRPEWAAGAAQQPIGISRTAGFDPPDNLRQVKPRPKDHVNVIRHQGPGTQFVSAVFLALQEDSCDAGSDRGLCQPPRTGYRGIEEPVRFEEFRAFRSEAVSGCARWQGTVETPCHEVRRVLVLPMRKAGMIFRAHGSIGL
ncbi:MAG: hypothetical protein JWO80_2159 [Bryobacterales bacterium]|nr:hypothetical protein [Bryobacterales bacterium]